MGEAGPIRRILLIHNTLAETGGAETHFRSEIEELRRRGYEVFVFSFRERGEEVALDAWTRVHTEASSPAVQRVFKFTFNPGAYRDLERFVDEIRPDVVHLHMNTKYPLAVLTALRGVPVVQSIHSNGMFCPTGWLVRADDMEVCEGGAGLKCLRHGCVSAARLPLHVALERAWHAAARRTVCAFTPPSKHLSQRLEHFGFRGVRRLPLYVPSEMGPPQPGERDMILYVGVVTPQKGVENLVRAMPAVLRRRPEARLVVVGDGSSIDACADLARGLGVAGRVDLVGRVPNREVSGFYQRASVCVIPSLWLENSPVVAYEAMLAGRPIVGSDRGGIPDLIESGRCGIVFPAKDVEAMADAIARVLEDPDLARTLGESGHRHLVETMNRERFFAALLPILDAARRGEPIPPVSAEGS